MFQRNVEALSEIHVLHHMSSKIGRQVMHRVNSLNTLVSSSTAGLVDGPRFTECSRNAK